MSSNATPNVYEMLARSNKADKLIAVLVRNGWHKDYLLDAMGDRHWESVAAAAGVNKPSRDTIALVRQRLAQTQGAADASAPSATSEVPPQSAS